MSCRYFSSLFSSACSVARRLALSQFITGNRRTALAPGELLVAIHVPKPVHAAQSAFLKLGRLDHSKSSLSISRERPIACENLSGPDDPGLLRM